MRFVEFLTDDLIIEIALNPNSHDENIEAYAGFFTDPPLSSMNGIDLKEARVDTLTMMALFDHQGIFSFLSVEDGAPYPKVDMTITKAGAYRNKGWVRRLFTEFFQRHGPFTSSGIQTQEAQWAWQALMRRPGNLKLHAFSVGTGEKTPLAPGDHNKVFDGDDNTVILVENALLTEERAFPYRTVRWWGFTDPLYPNP